MLTVYWMLNLTDKEGSQSPYSGFRFGPNISPSEFCARPGPKSQAGSGTGRLDLPTKCQQPFSE